MRGRINERKVIEMIANKWTRGLESRGFYPDWRAMAEGMLEEAAYCYRMAVRNELHHEGHRVPEEVKDMFARMLETAGCDPSEVREAFYEVWTSEMEALGKEKAGEA